MANTNPDFTTHSYIAFHSCGGLVRPVEVLKSGAGYYIGATCPTTYAPLSRDSVQYYRNLYDARAALSSGSWTQRLNP